MTYTPESLKKADEMFPPNRDFGLTDWNMVRESVAKALDEARQEGREARDFICLEHSFSACPPCIKRLRELEIGIRKIQSITLAENQGKACLDIALMAQALLGKKVSQ